MIVLDTTVLVYATGGEHPLREPCRQLVRLIADGTVAATTTIEVVQEFVHVRARRTDREAAAELARHYVDLLTPLLLVDDAALQAGLSLFAGSDRLGAFDSVLAAAAKLAGAAALVSADAAFAEVPGLTYLAPTNETVAALTG